MQASPLQRAGDRRARFSGPGSHNTITKGTHQKNPITQKTQITKQPEIEQQVTGLAKQDRLPCVECCARTETHRATLVAPPPFSLLPPVQIFSRAYSCLFAAMNKTNGPALPLRACQHTPRLPTRIDSKCPLLHLEQRPPQQLSSSAPSRKSRGFPEGDKAHLSPSARNSPCGATLQAMNVTRLYFYPRNPALAH